MNAARSADPGTYAFADGRFMRAVERRTEEAWLAKAWADGGRAIGVDRSGRILVDRQDESIHGLDATVLQARPGQGHGGAFLGLLDGTAWFAATVDNTAALPSSTLAFTDLRTLAASLPASAAALAAYARALLHWQSRKRFCGVCGAPTTLGDAGHKATCRNQDCGAVYFPRIDPAILVIVTDGEHCLLGRQPTWPEQRYSTLAGFVEPGETLEAAVAREVFEEAGIVIGSARYVASQPWPFPASLMLGFEATAGRPVGPIRIGAELADALWINAKALLDRTAALELLLPPATSLSYHLIAGWCEQITGLRPQPGPSVLTPR